MGKSLCEKCDHESCRERGHRSQFWDGVNNVCSSHKDPNAKPKEYEPATEQDYDPIGIWYP